MKKVLAIVIILVMTFAFTATALASEQSATASVSLKNAAYVINTNFTAYASDGVEGANDIHWEVLKSASSLMLRIDRNPVGVEVKVALQSAGNNWNWVGSEEVFKMDDVFKQNEDGEGGTITLRITQMAHWGDFKSDGGGKILVGYWGDGSGGFADLGVTGAWLTGVPRAIAEEHDAPTTGVVSFIGIAALVLATSGTGAFIVTRKLKK